MTSLGLAPSSISIEARKWRRQWKLSLGEPSALVIFAATCSGRHPRQVNIGKRLCLPVFVAEHKRSRRGFDLPLPQSVSSAASRIVGQGLRFTVTPVDS